MNFLISSFGIFYILYHCFNSIVIKKINFTPHRTDRCYEVKWIIWNENFLPVNNLISISLFLQIKLFLNVKWYFFLHYFCNYYKFEISIIKYLLTLKLFFIHSKKEKNVKKLSNPESIIFFLWASKCVFSVLNLHIFSLHFNV